MRRMEEAVIRSKSSTDPTVSCILIQQAAAPAAPALLLTRLRVVVYCCKRSTGVRIEVVVVVAPSVPRQHR